MEKIKTENTLHYFHKTLNKNRKRSNLWHIIRLKNVSVKLQGEYENEITKTHFLRK